MRLLDVVNQLKILLPEYTSLVSSTLTASSIVASGGTATITTAAPHNQDKSLEH